MKKLQTIMTSAILAISVLMTPVVLTTVDAGAATCATPRECVEDGASVKTGTGTQSLGGLITNIVNILLYVLGAIAVIMIVVGGIRYTLSNGDSAAIKGAKDTILYSVIGLIVAILAYAIVNFVLTSFT